MTSVEAIGIPPDAVGPSLAVPSLVVTIAAVVLAAGAGSRFAASGGTVPKPLAQVRGQALVDRVLTTVDAAGFDDFAFVRTNLFHCSAQWRMNRPSHFHCLDDGDLITLADLVSNLYLKRNHQACHIRQYRSVRSFFRLRLPGLCCEFGRISGRQDPDAENFAIHFHIKFPEEVRGIG